MSDDYKIGYGKPPKKSQWKTGQSGNSKGRPKGSKNLKSYLSQELMEPVFVKEGGKTKTVTKQQAMVKGLVAAAMKGNVKACSKVIDLTAQLVPHLIELVMTTDLSAEDQKILVEYEKKIETGVKARQKGSKAKHDG